MLDKTHYLGECDSIYVTVRGEGHRGCMWGPCNPNLYVILMDKGKITAPLDWRQCGNSLNFAILQLSWNCRIHG